MSGYVKPALGSAAGFEVGIAWPENRFAIVA